MTDHPRLLRHCALVFLAFALACGDDTGPADAATADAVLSDGGGLDSAQDAMTDAERVDVGSEDAAMGTDGGPDVPVPRPGPLAWEDCEGGGRVLTAGPDDYRAVLGTLMPGDTLQLQGGTYARGLPISVSGEEGRCIVIEGAAGERPLFEGSDAFNIIAFRGASWVKVRGVDIDGLGRAGFGVASQGADVPVHHIVIEDLEMVGLAGSQQIVGISTKTPAWDWVIRGNRILEAGTGLYLGNSNGRQPFVRGLIEGNLVRNPLGYSMQIKHQVAAGREDLALPGLPSEANTIIRYNAFINETSGGGASGPRPNLLLGHLPTRGSGMEDRYLVYGNLFYENPVENLFQGEGNVALYDNVFFTTGMGGILIRPHNGVPRRVDVFHNTIVAAGRGISVTGAESGAGQRVAANLVFAGADIRSDGDVVVEGNLEHAAGEAGDVLREAMRGLGEGLDLRPQMDAVVTSPVLLDSSYLDAFVDGALDYDRWPRTEATAGAFVPARPGEPLTVPVP